MQALARMGSPEAESRSRDYDGRRLVRVDGGYIVLNFMKYRDKDFGAAERMRLLRQRKKAARVTPNSDDVTPNALRVTPNSDVGRVQRQSTDIRQSINQAPRADGPTANPLIAGRRAELERECLALVGQLAELTGEDPIDVIARASGYTGAATTKLNPSTMTDDRLANTVRDLRADVAAESRKPKAVPRGA